jgi:hypothetical protein
MAKRLVMIGCMSNMEGSWYTSRVPECIARSIGIGQGDEVGLEVLAPDGTSKKIVLVDGSVPLALPIGTRYRIYKKANGHLSRTTVEIET